MKRELLRIESLKKKLDQDALKQIFLYLYENEMLGVLTRSTAQRHALFEILTGGLQADSGRIFLYDQKLELNSKFYANRLGIYGVSGNSTLIFNMSVAENIFIDRPHISGFHIVSRKLMFSEASDILRKAQMHEISPHTLVRNLTPAMRCSIEVLKAVFSKARILVIDDVTSLFTKEETKKFETLLRYAKEKGTSVLYLTNRINSLLECCDRGAVLCDGMTVDILEKEQLRLDILLPTLSGNFSSTVYKRKRPQRDLSKDDVILCAEHLMLDSDDQFSFTLHKNEILGICDKKWKYSEKISNMLAGASKCDGTISIGNRNVRLDSFHAAIQNGICVINEQNIKYGFLHHSGLIENIVMTSSGRRKGKWGIIHKNQERKICKQALKALGCEDYLEKFSGRMLPRNISRNTKMHILAARWLCAEPKVIVFVNPYIDLNDLTMEDFQSMIEHICAAGVSVMIFSMGTKELSQTCDRILYLSE